MKPMVITSTQFISYRDIRVNETDLLEDAWGLKAEFNDVMEILNQLKTSPGSKLTARLIERIRNKK